VPSSEELRFDTQARAEGRAKALALPEAHLIRLLNANRDESERSTTKLRAGWTESWRYYQSEVDYGDKEEWQSAVWIPTPWSAVEQASNVLKLGLMNNSDFAKIDGVDQKDKLLAEKIWNPVLLFAFTKSGFIPKFVDAMKVGLATGMSMYLKFRYPSMPSPILDSVQLMASPGQMPTLVPQYKMRRQSALDIGTVPPWNIYRDPRSRPGEQWSGSYLIHEDYVDRAVLSGSTVYKNLDTALASGASGGTDDRSGAAADAQRKGQTWEPHEFRKPILASEWYGDILDENGDLVYPDALMIAADRKVLIYGPTENPLWAVDPRTFRRKWPFIGFSPIRHPLRFEGWGILQAVTPLAVLFSNLFNLFTDGLNWKVNQPTELNTNLLEEDDDHEHYPGKLWRKIGEGQLLSPAAIGQMSTGEVLAAMQFMQTLWEQNAFVNNFVMGSQGTRSQITKGEVQIRTGQSMGMFDGMGRDIEEGGKACLELAYDFMSQYMTDWSDPTIAAVVGPQYSQLLNMMEPAARMQELGGQYNYTFSGITQSLQKADLLGRLMQAASLAAEGIYAGYTNPAEVLSTIFDAMGVRDKIPVSEEQMVPAAVVQKMLAGKQEPPKVNVSLRGDLPPMMAEELAGASPQEIAAMAAAGANMLPKPTPGAPRQGPPTGSPGNGKPTMRQMKPSPNELSTAPGA
jgi:hypothetical protein